LIKLKLKKLKLSWKQLARKLSWPKPLAFWHYGNGVSFGRRRFCLWVVNSFKGRVNF
jgi:hypothetical protein